MGWSGQKRKVEKRIYVEIEVQQFSTGVDLLGGRKLEVFNNDNGDLCVQVRDINDGIETPHTYYSSRLDNETVRHLSVILQEYIKGLDKQHE